MFAQCHHHRTWYIYRQDPEWAYHNNMLGAGDQVAAQYTKNSNQYQSLGKKKPVEDKAPNRKGKKNGTK
jgi:hypothetical protein